MNTFWSIFAAVVPSIGVGLLFWLAMRSLVNADRTERAALARMDAREREVGTQPIPPAADSDS
ncbi:MAG TPA: hypothetical protein VFW79_04875 [Cellulomonas sp.]|uniref:hypothetical protein n=1 Tax=Cellulomonas sp. TaxID=40001 RepID=UPI002E37A9DA|nr:hypothetical protein [Cellulomonas sp.]HEX5331958.1 hypothetical protein [Cellulomonas sp.]